MDNYNVIRETEKAIYIKYPYYELTSPYKKAHIQKYIKQWVPKSVINIPLFIEREMRKRGFFMDNKRIGIAPIKTEIEPLVYLDSDKIKERFDAFYAKVFNECGVKPHHRNGFDIDEAYFEVNGKVYDYSKEYYELKNYKPTIIVKQYN